MNPKVLSIYQNAKIFLSEEELRELRTAIDKDLGKSIAVSKKKKKLDPVAQWGEELNNILLTTYFNRKRKKPV